jgi:hypothetical protein
MKKAFLSYKFGDNVQTLKEMLSSFNVSVFDVQSDMEYGSSLQQSIKNAILQCDFLVFVYSEDNPNIAFEAGIAISSNKPIFSIFAGGNEYTFLMDSPYVNAQPTEIDKIRFAFELFLENSFPKKEKLASDTILIKPQVFYGGGEMVPTKAYFDVEREYELAKYGTEKVYYQFFALLFNAYGVNFAKNPRLSEKDLGADFSIWNDGLTPILSNPILIEIKRKINRNTLEELLNQIVHWKKIMPGSIIVLYEQLENLKVRDLPVHNEVLFVSISELISELESRGFATAIKNIRNRVIHS